MRVDNVCVMYWIGGSIFVKPLPGDQKSCSKLGFALKMPSEHI